MYCNYLRTLKGQKGTLFISFWSLALVEGWLSDKVAKTYVHVANSLFFCCPLLDSTSILRQEVATAHMQLAQKIVSETQRTGGLWLAGHCRQIWSRALGVVAANDFPRILLAVRPTQQRVLAVALARPCYKMLRTVLYIWIYVNLIGSKWAIGMPLGHLSSRHIETLSGRIQTVATSLIHTLHHFTTCHLCRW